MTSANQQPPREGLLRTVRDSLSGVQYDYTAGSLRRAIMLLPAKTDTHWWHELVVPYADEIAFIKGRIRFDGPKTGSPTFGSAIVIFGPTRCPHCNRGLKVSWWDPRRSE